MRVCYSMLDRCNGLLVVTMDGWRDSKGVAMEIERWSQRHGTGSLYYASPIRVTERWEPRFARRAYDVCGDPNHERAQV
jgi:Domain of unknown function (DUF1937)